MGLFSGLVKAGIAAAKVINNADSISDIIDKAPEMLGKAKETVVKIQDAASTVDLHVQSKKQEKEKVIKGQKNEAMVKVQSEELFHIEYSVPCKFERIDSLGNDYFLVKDNGKAGVIDIDNNIVIPIEYEEIGNFGDGLFPVKKNGKYGFVNENNDVIIDFIFRDADKFVSGLAPARKPTETTTDKNGRLTEEYKSSCGYIDKNGSFIIGPCYASAEPFESNGLARIEKSVPNMTIGYYGVIDVKHNTVINPVFYSVDIHKNYIECIDKNCDCFYFDLQGNPIEEPHTTEISEEIEKVYHVSSEENDYMLINGRKLYLYHDSREKYGWYEILENEPICRIKPMFDNDIRIRYTKEKKKYSIVQYGGLYGIIKFNESEV